MSINIDSTPTLYALNKDGSFQQWKVYTEGADVIVEFGKVGGKLQQKRTTCEMKNVGRANETSADFQALLEAKSKWEKQVRLGYRESTDQLEAEEVFTPMLAHDYLKRGSAIEVPCYTQPKLDGVRALVLVKDGVPSFNSRGNKTYPVQGKLVDEVVSLSNHSGFDKFDGELYIHGLSLQKIVALTKKWRTHATIAAEIQKDYEGDVKRRDKAISIGMEKYKNFDGDMIDVDVVPELDVNRYGGYESADLQFHIFDIPVNNNSPWHSVEFPEQCRLADLFTTYSTVAEQQYSKIAVVMGCFYDTIEQVEWSVGVNMQAGFEGTMIRNFKGLYEYGQRSSDLQKWKIFQTAEAKVTGSKEDKNGEGVLDCIEKDGTEFSCKIKGTHAERTQAKMLKLIGKFITFSFQARTDKGVPQFPVGQYEREVNPETWEPLN
ncbi:DNA ligase [Erwinia phage Hena1]|uniref:DNA ligase n=1 Tax=Erwinia phage Hena1 TaxID=2678601 RepID=A0A6B9JCA9_9CAUD|nr:ATP-dependent DNA ligase [Erwinia phage Hena1]QGZ16252.1 DNA ligase [Erwinia phage Hena1]